MPWAKLWKEKYAENWQTEELIRMKDPPAGSPIWNLAKANRNIFHDSCFWELCDGTNALFWDDSWKQLPKLESPNFLPHQRWFKAVGKIKVHQY